MSGTTTKSAEMESLLTRAARRDNVVIPDGVDRERFRPGDRAAARAELGWPPAAKIALFIGRREAVEKRLSLAQEVAALVRSRTPGFELKVIEGIDPSRMPLCYVAADCLLHTSVSEGSPNVVKEALACDLPVVATPSGDVRELLRGVEHCAVCEPEPIALANSLLRALSADGGSNGRELTGYLDTRAIAERTAEYYSRFGLVAAAKPAPRPAVRLDPARSA
jgi:glycosyltransferase involved in cell wall biosynthesis